MNDMVFRILKLCKRFDYSTCQEILIITKTIALEANILEDAFISRQIQKIPDYLKSLAASFHKFYNENRVVGNENEDSLLKVFAVVAVSIKTAFNIMGITAKDRM